MALSRTKVKIAILNILRSGEASRLELERKIQKILPEANSPEALQKGKNHCTLLRNTIAWAKVELQKEGAIHCSPDGTLAPINKTLEGIAPEPTKTTSPTIPTNGGETPGGPQPTQEPTHPQESPELCEEELIRNLLPAFIKAIKEAGYSIVRTPRKKIEWKPTRLPKVKPLPATPKENVRTRLTALSDEIKALQKAGKLPAEKSINEILRERYHQEGHFHLKTVMEWKEEGRIPKHGQKALLLWKKTPSNHFLPLCLFSAKQVRKLLPRRAYL